MKCTSMCKKQPEFKYTKTERNTTEMSAKETIGGISKMIITLDGIAKILLTVGVITALTIYAIKAKKEDVAKMAEAVCKQQLIHF